MLTEGEQGPGVSPGSGILVVLLKERCQACISVEEEQESRQGVAAARVVARIQPQHVLPVLHSCFSTASGPEGMRQPQPGSHVRPGFEDAPEVADISLKRFLP